jgi:hypothetical protein
MYPNRDLATKGGFIETTHIGRPPKYVHLKVRTAGVDQIPTLLQQGELVIPKKHTPKVIAFLKSKKIHLPGT